MTKQIVLFTLSGFALAAASLFPETYRSLVFALLFAGFFFAGLQDNRLVLKGAWLSGIVFTAVAFYWLPATLTRFGGFPSFLSLLLFALFCLFSGIQFVLVVLIYRRVARWKFAQSSISFSLAWLSMEMLFPRLFPWALGHSLAAYTPIAGLAEYAGVYPLSFLVAWCGSFLAGSVLAADRKRLKPEGAALLIVVLAAVAVGQHRSREVAQALEKAPQVMMALVQGNLQLEEKRDLAMFQANMERYRDLSRRAQNQGAQLLLWPETVVAKWYPENLSRVANTAFDTFPESSLPIIFGSLSFREKPADELRTIAAEASTRQEFEANRYRYFNSAIGIDKDKRIVGRYHKQVLMPFGEYLPLASVLPWLKQLSPNSGDFTSGDKKAPITFEIASANSQKPVEVAAGALICYEDLVSRISREAVVFGANVLVNLTNDAWYGDTAAPYQHHLLALWRAIETRRYLLRVTNTGYTAVVDPLGHTTAALPVFADGYLIEQVKLLQNRTLYAEYGDLLSWLLTLSAVLLAILPYRLKV